MEDNKYIELLFECGVAEMTKPTHQSHPDAGLQLFDGSSCPVFHSYQQLQ